MPGMEFAGFRLDTINLCLWRRGNVEEDERTALTPKAFDVLRYLVEHAGRLVTQDEMLSALCAPPGRRSRSRTIVSPMASAGLSH
jgi:DNA-binding response OmpR family regulator